MRNAFINQHNFLRKFRDQKPTNVLKTSPIDIDFSVGRGSSKLTAIRTAWLK